MRQDSNLAKDPAEKVVKDIRRATRKQYSAEEKIRIVSSAETACVWPRTALSVVRDFETKGALNQERSLAHHG